MSWFGPRGDCGCCGCLHAQWDYRYDRPSESQPAGHSALELLGNAGYAGDPNSATGKIILPDSTSGIKLKQGSEMQSFEHALAGFMVFTPWTNSGFGWDTPVGATYRLFFESDYDEQNYVFADVKAEATSSSYASLLRNWTIRLGFREGGSDTYYEAWAQIHAIKSYSVTPFLVLERRGCKSIGPIGCTEGYACHYYSTGLPSPENGTEPGDANRYCWEPLSAAYRWEIFPGGEEIFAEEPVIDAFVPAGATIDVALSDPAGTYCGIRRMDDLGKNLEVYAVGIGNAKPINDSCKCLAGSVSTHNVCREIEPFSILIEVAGESTIVGQSTYQRQFRYKGFTLDTSGMTLGQVPWAFGPEVPSTSPGGSSNILRFQILCDHNLASTRTGEDDWFSRGQDDSLEEYIVVSLRDWRQYDPFQVDNEYYDYRWEVRIALPDGDRDVECDLMTLTLNFADAEITYRPPSGPSVYDPLTGDLVMTMY